MREFLAARVGSSVTFSSSSPASRRTGRQRTRICRTELEEGSLVVQDHTNKPTTAASPGYYVVTPRARLSITARL